LPDRRGYLDRLVDNLASRRDRAARVPRQIAWGPTKPAGTADAEQLAPEAQPDVPVRKSRNTGRVDEPEPNTPEVTTDRPRPVATTAVQPLRVVAATPVARDVPPRPATAVQRTVTRPSPIEKPRPGTARPVSAVERSEPQRVIAAPVATETPRTPAAATDPRLPDEVRHALDRLAALSQHVPQAQPARPARPPAPPPRPEAIETVRREAKQPAPVVPPRHQRSTEPTRTPQVHIGRIEVTVAEPTPPPPPPAPPPTAPPQPAAPPPAGRLSRPSTGFGFGQV
jgi:hypothetical protein